MVEVHCRTNLDLYCAEKWPDKLPFRPMVGDVIYSLCDWGGGKRLALKVVGVNFKPRVGWMVDAYGEGYYAEIELHLTELWASRGISEFQKWYKEFTGCSHSPG